MNIIYKKYMHHEQLEEIIFCKYLFKRNIINEFQAFNFI